MKQQLLAINRTQECAPNLSWIDRFLFGLWSLFFKPHLIRPSAVILKPSTLLGFHDAPRKRNYRLHYSSRQRGKRGTGGPSRELIQIIVDLKQRNPRCGCPNIAEQISKSFGIESNKKIVRRILNKHSYPAPDAGGGPSWLTFIGHMKDRLWSGSAGALELFRCESVLLKSDKFLWQTHFRGIYQLPAAA